MGFLGVRLVATSNNDSVYLVLKSINDAKYHRFKEGVQSAGHDNFYYHVGTWSHRFSERIHEQTEAHFMWQRDAVVGGTLSIGPAVVRR